MLHDQFANLALRYSTDILTLDILFSYCYLFLAWPESCIIICSLFRGFIIVLYAAGPEYKFSLIYFNSMYTNDNKLTLNLHGLSQSLFQNVNHRILKMPAMIRAVLRTNSRTSKTFI